MDERNMNHQHVVPQQAVQQQPSGMPNIGSLDKVRDILFGENIRENDKKLNQIEDRIRRETFDLRDELKNRFDSLEVYIRKEIENLSNQIKNEREDREDFEKDIVNDLKTTTKNLERKVRNLEEELNKSQKDVREQLLDQARTQSDQTLQKYEELWNMFEREIKMITSEKTDKSFLSTMLIEMAMKLNNESFGNNELLISEARQE